MTLRLQRTSAVIGALVALYVVISLLAGTRSRHEIDLGSGRLRKISTTWLWLTTTHVEGTGLSLAASQHRPEQWSLLSENNTGMFGPTCGLGRGAFVSGRVQTLSDAFELLSIPKADRQRLADVALPLLPSTSEWDVDFGQSHVAIQSGGTTLIRWPSLEESGP